MRQTSVLGIPWAVQWNEDTFERQLAWNQITSSEPKIFHFHLSLMMIIEAWYLFEKGKKGGGSKPRSRKSYQDTWCHSVTSEVESEHTRELQYIKNNQQYSTGKCFKTNSDESGEKESVLPDPKNFLSIPIHNMRE